jgi:Mrp family chromosome partitioning ATPase
MARHVDGIVVVVEAGHTTESEVRQTVETIAAAGGRVIGLILNKQRNWIPTWLERLLRS